MTSELLWPPDDPPRQGLGLMRLRHPEAGAPSDPDRDPVAVVHAAIDAGVPLLDTAEMYGNEELVGKTVRGRRDEVLLCSKFGVRWGDSGRFEDWSVHADAATVVSSCEGSLRRLGVDVIDLLQIHWPDPTTPIADTMGALAELVHAGKVRAVGVSNYSIDELEEARAALGDVPLASDQPRYSLVRREIEADVLPYAREHEVGLVVYSPLEQGLLTGKVPAERTFAATDGRRDRPTFRPANRAKVNALLAEVVAPIAAAHDATLGACALAWTLQQPGVTAVLAGARTPAQVDENARAGDLVLPPEEWSAIDRAFAALELDLGC
jgi:aryl-alcohol dehydrogenase-like predicted oxidoreductase